MLLSSFLFFFFFTDTAPTEIYTLSLHDALPIYVRQREAIRDAQRVGGFLRRGGCHAKQSGGKGRHSALRDRKSTRLNSSHLVISYAVFCLKKKKKKKNTTFSTHDPITQE